MELNSASSLYGAAATGRRLTGYLQVATKTPPGFSYIVGALWRTEDGAVEALHHPQPLHAGGRFVLLGVIPRTFAFLRSTHLKAGSSRMEEMASATEVALSDLDVCQIQRKPEMEDKTISPYCMIGSCRLFL
jgi:hypothetical protein